MTRSSAYRRHQRERATLRRRRIVRIFVNSRLDLVERITRDDDGIAEIRAKGHKHRCKCEWCKAHKYNRRRDADR